MTPCTDCNYYYSEGQGCIAKLTPKDEECDRFEEFDAQLEMTFKECQDEN